jgi:hypothetical protein
MVRLLETLDEPDIDEEQVEELCVHIAAAIAAFGEERGKATPFDLFVPALMLALARGVAANAFKPDAMKAIIVKYLPQLIDDWRRELRDREAHGDEPAVEREH